MEPMTESTDDTSDDDTKAPSAPERRWLPVTLVVFATVIAVLSAVTTWVRTEALDTDEWVSVSSDLLDEPEVTEALATFITDRLFTQVDVAGELESLLPDGVSGLAGPIAGALRGTATDNIERFLASEQFGELWARANEVAHETLVGILRDETRFDATSTADGNVTLDLGEVITNVGASIGIPQAALDRLPADVGNITLFESEELASVQRAVQVLDFLSWFLFLVVVALYALAVYLARDRRPQMLRTVGIGLLVGGVTVLLLRAFGINVGVDALVQDSANLGWATVVIGVATELLRQIGWSGIIFGVLIIGFAALLGDHRWAVAIRRRLAQTSNWLVAGGVGAVLAVLFWWSPGRALDRWVTALTLIALLIGAGVALTKRIRDEFPTEVPAG